jgi:PAS domain S-box-containing protein
MDIFLSIARNGALLLSLSFLYSLFIPYLVRSPSWLSSISTGLLFGCFALLNMFEPLRFGEGVVIDLCNVILMVAAMVGGFRAGFAAFAVVAVYRFYPGGDAMWAGLASMLTAMILGIIYHRLKRGQRLRFDRSILPFGILVALESLAWTLSLPNGYGWTLISSIALPVLLIYPFVSYILVWLIASAHQRLELGSALQESEGRFRTIFEQSIQFLCLMDADGTIRNISPSLLNASGLKETEIINKKYWDVGWIYLPEPRISEIKKAIQNASRGQASQIRIDLNAPDQQVILNIAIQRIRETGQILLEAHDISEQITGEKRRLELQFERERNDILLQLIGDASHHLRTPLAIISSSLYLLRKQTEKADKSAEWQQKMESQFRKLDTARQDLLEIVEDLLSMMRLDSEAAHRFERHELAPYVMEILETYQTMADEKKITLSYDKSELSLPVFIVPMTFRQVIANLIENALRYTPEAGRVSVSLGQADDMAEVAIEDSGIGIPEDELPRIFDRFYRAKNASSQSSKGTGLGLAIVKKTVDMHQGRIEVKSEIGKGTRVIILIPLARANVAAIN